MNLPEWTKPGIYGAIIGAIAIAILGFSVGGWTTEDSANEMAESRAGLEITRVMTPICVARSERDLSRASKLADIEAASGFNRRQAVMDTGWATLPGETVANRDLAQSCLDALDIDA